MIMPMGGGAEAPAEKIEETVVEAPVADADECNCGDDCDCADSFDDENFEEEDDEEEETDEENSKEDSAE
jgi:hypothetical protein